MNPDDYLWDRTGQPDPEIEHLERLLAPLAYRPRPYERSWVRRHLLFTAAIAAALVVAMTAVWSASRRPQGPSWQVVALQGPREPQRISRGGTIETGATSRLRLELDTFGHVVVEPGSRLQLLVTKPDEQRMSLIQGKIHAEIWAPPHQFYVNTPSAVAVDLGCSYSLAVDKAGVSTVHVDFGWVAFEDKGRESFITADAACVTRPGRGPGIPYYEDAPEQLREAVAEFDSSGSADAIPKILKVARAKDALTVWHLLRRVPSQDRGVVFDRLAQLIRIPPDVTRDQALAGNSAAIDHLWDALGLGDTAWWRMWKR